MSLLPTRSHRRRKPQPTAAAWHIGPPPPASPILSARLHSGTHPSSAHAPPSACPQGPVRRLAPAVTDTARAIVPPRSAPSVPSLRRGPNENRPPRRPKPADPLPSVAGPRSHRPLTASTPTCETLISKGPQTWPNLNPNQDNMLRHRLRAAWPLSPKPKPTYSAASPSYWLRLGSSTTANHWTSPAALPLSLRPLLPADCQHPHEPVTFFCPSTNSPCLNMIPQYYNDRTEGSTMIQVGTNHGKREPFRPVAASPG